MLSLVKEKNNSALDSLDKETLEFFIQNGFNLKFSSKYLEKTDQVFLSTWDYDIGTSSILTFASLLQGGRALTPLFMLKQGERKNKCTYNFNIVVRNGSSITNLKNLIGKKIAVQHIGNTDGAIIAEVFAEENVRVKTLFFTHDHLDWSAEALKSGSIDAIIEMSRTTIERSNLNTLGNYVDGKFEKYPDFKIAESRNLNFPCGILYVNQTLTETERLNIANTFKKIGLTSNDTVSSNFDSLGIFSAVEELPNGIWERLNQIINYKGPRGRYADEIVYLNKKDEMIYINNKEKMDVK